MIYANLCVYTGIWELYLVKTCIMKLVLFAVISVNGDLVWAEIGGRGIWRQMAWHVD